VPRLIYFVSSSLDGYLTDEQGDYGWAVPDEEVVAFINEQVRGVSTYLYGRRMYEEMRGWGTDPTFAAQSPESADFAALWQAASKVVFSTTLESVETRNTELRRTFEPSEVERLKQTSTGDLTVEGPTLGAHAFRAGLVDEVHLLFAPVTVGGGLRVHPDGVRCNLQRLDERAFENGMVYLRYASAISTTDLRAR
jgi:dihydrofolate reductase